MSSSAITSCSDVRVDVDGARGAHLHRQAEPVVVDVGDDHMARADMAGYCRGHDADGPGARDQHILAHQVERQRGVRGVAVGVEDGGQIVADARGDLEGVEGRDHQVLGKAAGAVDAHADGVAAQVAAPGAAVAAVAAGDVAFAGDTVTERKAAHFLADLDHFADIFVAHVHGHRNGLLRPLVPVPDVDVRATDGGLADADHHVVVADRRPGHAGHRQARAAFQFGKCSHGSSSSVQAIAPRVLPTLVKAATAWSICATVCAADICVRMRALPRGTTGKLKPMT
jgi:hypothetical protein